ncbi:CocE/NonD family hydrolase [archaeon]|nr:MAG: CocE/NonD family hydrolase [archaeon]
MLDKAFLRQVFMLRLPDLRTLSEGVVARRMKRNLDLIAEYNVPVRMQDGIHLSADVYHPARKGRYPVLLSRTYYGKSQSDLGDPRSKQFIEYFVGRGYAVVIQDCRGRYDSEGEFYPEIHEADDGYDTIEWCAKQAWSNGRVGMFGCSYPGCVQWYCAHRNSPHLKCIVPRDATSDPYFDGGFMRGGVVQGFMEWLLHTAGRTDRTSLLKAVNLSDAYKELPMRELDERLGFRFPFWKDYVDHSTYGSYWKRTSVHNKYPLIRVPSLNVGGWYSYSDVMGTIRNFVGVSTKGSGKTRKNHRLVMGPWEHCESAPKIGEVDFGSKAKIDFLRMHRRWFDYWLKGIGRGMASEPPVHVFVMGANRWRRAKKWPLPNTRYVKCYLHSDGHANTLNGDGTLDPNPPGSERPDKFTFDPANPCPDGMKLRADGKIETLDQRPNERRDDVLVYSTRALKNAIEVTGPIRLFLFAASSAKDTDFTGKLADVHPNGPTIRLTSGIMRARFRKSYERPSLIKPGRVYLYEVDLWATSNLFRRNHRIRLEVSSSDFPMFLPNTNMGGRIGYESRRIVAKQTIYHDVTRPSHLLLPVILQPSKGKVPGPRY